MRTPSPPPAGRLHGHGLVLASLFMVACAGDESPTPPATSVLLVTLDTTRADRLGCYGGAAPVSPRIDALARRGVRFARAHAPVPLTLPSHATLLTGRHPTEHGVRSNTVFRLPEEGTTLAERLRDHGYRTGAFVAAFVLDHEFGLDRGFEVYDDDLGRPDGTVIEERPAAEVTDSVLRWLEQGTDAPFFAWVHFYDPHFPHTPPEPYATRFADPYHAEIAYADAQLGRILADLDRRQLLDDTLVVVTADHGEGLGDHGEGTHGYFLYQSTMHVPLVFAHQDLPAGQVVDAAVGLVDVAPTVLDFLGLEAIDGSGTSRLPEMRGEPGDEHLVFMESELPRLVYGFQPVAAITDGRHKLIEGGELELFDLDQDPGENARPVDAPSPLVEHMRRRLQEYRDMQASAAAHDPDNEVLQKLGALGYAVGRITQVTRDQWTREELLRVIALRDQARDRLLTGDLTGCLENARELIERAPECAQGHAIAGAALGRLGQYQEAITSLKRALELDHHQPEAHWNLATCYYVEGRVDEALAEAEATLALYPRHLPARRRLAERALHKNDPETARAHLDALIQYGRGTPHGDWAAEQRRLLDSDP